MKLLLNRKFGTDLLTHGTLTCDTVSCVTMEPPKKNDYRKGRIPAGVYDVVIQYSGKFGMVMPFLLAVPGFTGIMIHPGNDKDDTTGCILVGAKYMGDDFITDSRKTFNTIFQIIQNYLKVGEKVQIEVVNEK